MRGCLEGLATCGCAKQREVQGRNRCRQGHSEGGSKTVQAFANIAHAVSKQAKSHTLGQSNIKATKGKFVIMCEQVRGRRGPVCPYNIPFIAHLQKAKNHDSGIGVERGHNKEIQPATGSYVQFFFF